MRYLSPQLQIALLLVILLAATLAYLSHSFVVEILAVGLAGAGAIGWTRPLKRLQLLGLAVFLLGIFIGKWFLLPVNTRAPIFFSLGHAATEYFLLLQAVLLVTRAPGKSPGSAFLPLGVATLMGAGLVPDISSVQTAVYQAVVLAFVILSALWSALSRTVQRESGRSASQGIRTSLLSVMVLLAAGGSAVGSLLLQRHWREIEIFINERLKVQNPWSSRDAFGLVGFSRQRESAIGSIKFLKSAQRDQVALRIIGNRPPGYLRGMVYEKYRSEGGAHDAWLAGKKEPRKRLPVNSLLPHIPAPEPWEKQFVLRPESAIPDRRFEMWPEATTDALFTELTTNVVTAPVEAIRVDEHDVVEATDLPPGSSYRLLGTEATEPALLSAELRQELLDVPPDLQTEFADLRKTVFGERKTPLQKIAAVEEFFDGGFKYNLGITVPAGQTPMRYFLREKAAAHCEYFATATVLLLRMAGVPCRYVTGYLAGSEYNHLGGYWIVRNQSAHAWTEAYVDGEGWRVVETTPSEGVPQQASDPQVSHLWDNAFLKTLRIRSLLTRGGGRATFQALWILFTALFTTLPGLVVTAILSVILYRLLRPLWKSRREALLIPPHVAELRRLLSLVDRKLRSRHLARHPGETLHQFAVRLNEAASEEPGLEPVADWYRSWATIRYGGEIEATRLAELQQRASTLGL